MSEQRDAGLIIVNPHVAALMRATLANGSALNASFGPP
jgi:hypothetical protein